MYGRGPKSVLNALARTICARKIKLNAIMYTSLYQMRLFFT